MAQSRGHPEAIKFCVAGKDPNAGLRSACTIATALRTAGCKSHLILIATHCDPEKLVEFQAMFTEVRINHLDAITDELGLLPPGPVVVSPPLVPGLETLSDPLCLILSEFTPGTFANLQLPGNRVWQTTIVAVPGTQVAVPPGSVATAALHNLSAVKGVAKQSAHAARLLLDLRIDPSVSLTPWSSLSQAHDTAVAAGVLARAGVAPLVRVDVSRGVFEFTIPAGQSASDLCGLDRAQRPVPVDRALLLAVLGDCVQGLARFHRAGSVHDGSALPLFNPLARIREDLAACTDPALARSVQSCLSELAAMLVDAESRLEREDTIVHGDMHVRRIVFPDDGGAPLITGLAHFAWGRREPDFAQLLAQSALSRPFAHGDVVSTFQMLVAQLRLRYDAASHAGPLDSRLISLYASANLLTRALQLKDSDPNRHPAKRREMVAAAERLLEMTSQGFSGRAGAMRSAAHASAGIA